MRALVFHWGCIYVVMNKLLLVLLYCNQKQLYKQGLLIVKQYSFGFLYSLGVDLIFVYWILNVKFEACNFPSLLSCCLPIYMSFIPFLSCVIICCHQFGYVTYAWS